MHKDTPALCRHAVTNHSINEKATGTNRSINGKIQPFKKSLVQQLQVSHWQKAVFIFKTLGEIRWAGEP